MPCARPRLCLRTSATRCNRRATWCEGCVKAASHDIDWQTLLARVYDIDSLKFPKCGGQLRIIVMLAEPEPIRAILESMGLP
jgi:hypothetical protein